jgi:MoaA/NifB/PqqE/SkfB family radical SAM enzyme
MDKNNKTLRSSDILSVMSPRSIWRILRGAVWARLDKHYAGSPLAVCWFVNFRCNARCSFCCKHEEIATPSPHKTPLDTDAIQPILARIRKSVSLLYLSGGEPLIHPQLLDILQTARKMRFRSIGLTSNLLALQDRPEVIDYLDVMAVSIHGSTPESHGAMLGLDAAAGQRVFDNLRWLAEHRRPGMRVLVNCVLTGERLGEIDEILEMTRELGVLVEFVPANVHGKEPPVSHLPEYRQAIDRLLEQRRNGTLRHLAGSSSYYRRIRDAQPFRCFPYGVANILPDGGLLAPCDIAGVTLSNVLDHPSLKAAVRATRGKLGDYPCPNGYCFKAGIIERSRLFGMFCP